VRQGGSLPLEQVAALLEVQDDRRVHGGGPRRRRRVETNPEGQAGFPVPERGLPGAQVQSPRSGERAFSGRSVGGRVDARVGWLFLLKCVCKRERGGGG